MKLKLLIKYLIILNLAIVTGCSTLKQEQGLETGITPSVSQTTEINTDQKLTSQTLNVPDMTFSVYDCPNEYCSGYSISLRKGAYLKVQKNGGMDDWKQLSQTDKHHIIYILDQIEFPNKKIRLFPSSPDCPYYQTDDVSYRIIIHQDSKLNMLEIYGGCKEMPTAYKALLDWFKALNS